MKTKPSTWITSIFIAIASVAVLWLGMTRDRVPAVVSSDDARVAADTALAGKLSGARYFNAPAHAEHVHEPGGPWITVHEAMVQVPRIAAERKLAADTSHQVEQLIGQLAEPHPYRMIGGPRVNLVRLNLSLDSIK